MKYRKYLIYLSVITLFLFFQGCRKDSPEDVLKNFIDLIRQGKGSEAFLEYVDLEDFMLMMGFSFNGANPEDKEVKEKEFREIWEKNSQKINDSFLKQMKEIKEYEIVSKEKLGKDYLFIIETVYSDNTRKREEVFLKRIENSFKIVMSKIKEVNDAE